MDNSAQAEFWNDAGATWVAQEAALDALFAPVLQATLAGAGLEPGQHVLDVGCGGGASACAAARRVGPTGQVLGVDIARPLLARAQMRAEQEGLSQVRFAETDAAKEPFRPHYDRLISRFGVMFFANPVDAFANLGKAMRPGGQLSLSAWGQISENPWFTLPAALAKAHFGPTPKSDPDAPGPFAFRDPDRVADILDAAGWRQVRITPTPVPLTPEGGAVAAAELCCHIGPIPNSVAHHNGSAEDVAQIKLALIEAWTGPDPLTILSEINMIQAVWE